MMSVFKVFLQSLFNIVRKKRLRGTLLHNLNNCAARYAFSKHDIDLYIQEKFTGLPLSTKTLVEDDADLVKVTIKGKSIYWPTSLTTKDLPWLYHEIFDDFKTNPSSYDHPSMNFEEKEWIIDAGAAEGYFSIFSLLKSSALLVVVEPLTLMKPALVRTLDLNASGRKTSIVSAALSDQVGWSEIQVDYDHICDSKLTSSAFVANSQVVNLVTERVSVITIDQLALQHSLGKNGLIKMDIEGYEMAALRGALNLLKECKPALAVAVYHGRDNALKCAKIIKSANPNYQIEFRGCYGYFNPPRPYMVFAH